MALVRPLRAAASELKFEAELRRLLRAEKRPVYFTSELMMFQWARKQGHTFFAAHRMVDKYGFQFTSFADWQDFGRIYLTPTPQRSFSVYLVTSKNKIFKKDFRMDRHFELLTQGGPDSTHSLAGIPPRPSRVHLDLDFPFDQRDEERAWKTVNLVRAIAARRLNELPLLEDRPVAPGDFFIKVSSRPKTKNGRTCYYNSFHLILPHIYFEDAKAGAAFRECLRQVELSGEEKELLYCMKDGHEEFIVDNQVYKPTQKMRLLHSCKWDDPGQVPFSALPDIPGTAHEHLRKSLISIPPSGDAIVVGIKDLPSVQEQEEPRPKRQKKARQQGNTPRSAAPSPQQSKRRKAAPRLEPATAEEVEAMRQLAFSVLRRLGDSTSAVGHLLPGERYGPHVYCFPCNNNGAERTCPHGNTHDSNHFNLLVRHGPVQQVSYHCLNEECPGRGRKVIIGYKSSFRSEFALDARSMAAADPVEQFSFQPSGKIFLEGLDVPDDRRCLVVKSGMGTGKTKALMEALEQNKGKWPRVIVLSTRRAFGRELHGKLGPEFAYYADVHDNKRLQKKPKSVVQFESLPRLLAGPSDEALPFDAAVADEMESLCCNMTSPTLIYTHRDTGALVNNVLKAAKVFEQQLRNPSTKVIVLDADVSMRTMSVLRHIVGPEQIRVHVNENVGMRRHIVLYSQKDVWLDQLKEDIRKGYKVMVACGSAELLETELRVFLEEYKISNYRVYTKANRGTLDEDLQDVNSCWKKLHVVAFSPCVTVGVDFEVEDHFDHIYAFGVSKSCVPRTLLQMCGRCRYPKTNLIHMFVPCWGKKSRKSGKKEPGPYVRPGLAAARAAIANPVQSCDEAAELVRATLAGSDCPPWLRTVYEFNVLETMLSEYSFVDELQQAALDKGYWISWHSTRVPLPPSSVDDTIRDLTDAWLARMEYQDSPPAGTEIKATSAQLCYVVEELFSKFMNPIDCVRAKHGKNLSKELNKHWYIQRGGRVKIHDQGVERKTYLPREYPYLIVFT